MVGCESCLCINFFLYSYLNLHSSLKLYLYLNLYDHQYFWGDESKRVGVRESCLFILPALAKTAFPMLAMWASHVHSSIFPPTPEFKHTCRKRSFPMDKDGLEFIFEETLVVKQMSQGQGPPSSILPSHPITCLHHTYYFRYNLHLLSYVSSLFVSLKI